MSDIVKAPKKYKFRFPCMQEDRYMRTLFARYANDCKNFKLHDIERYTEVRREYVVSTIMSDTIDVANKKYLEKRGLTWIISKKELNRWLLQKNITIPDFTLPCFKQAKYC